MKRLLGIHGLAWEKSRLLYIREELDESDLSVSVRLTKALAHAPGQPVRGVPILRLDDLILALLHLHGELDTATIARGISMNRKTAHRRLHRLVWHGLARVRQDGKRFLWRSVS